MVAALEQLPRRDGILFAASEGGRIEINNFRSRDRAPALQAAGIEHRRIYDMRHTFATWSLAAGMGIFTLARRMGTSVKMIDAAYGHPAQDAEDQDRGLLVAYDAAQSACGTLWARCSPRVTLPGSPRRGRPRLAGLLRERERRDSNPRPPA